MPARAAREHRAQGPWGGSALAQARLQQAAALGQPLRQFPEWRHQILMQEALSGLPRDLPVTLTGTKEYLKQESSQNGREKNQNQSPKHQGSWEYNTGLADRVFAENHSRDPVLQPGPMR